MFYQNSNDLVKHASAKSGHVQNSKETREVITASQSNVLKDNNKRVSFDDDNTTSSQNQSLSIGTQFQNMIQNLFSSSLLEGLTGDGETVIPVSSSSGIGSGSGRNNDQTAYVNSMAADNNKYTQQELDHINKVKGIINLIEKNDKNTRNQWVEVSDTAGITKYGYITSDGVFQIWHAPTSPSANPPNWLQTDTIKQNIGVIGCPAQSGSTQKIKIAGTWDKIKPYELIYADTDSSRLNPLFILINDSVRDPKISADRRGLFSCGNERGNVYVGERPTADFDLNDPYIKVGCYLIPDGITDSDLKNRQFTFQQDLREASISQCKRRAEDLGSSCFFISAPDADIDADINKPKNKGGCWVYTGHGQPYIDGILRFNEKANKCHAMTNPEPDEDGFLKSYTISNLKRLYGKNTEVKVFKKATLNLEILNMSGPWVTGEIPAEVKILDNGDPVYMVEDDSYTKMVYPDWGEKYYKGKISDFERSDWNNYTDTPGGKYILTKSGKYKDFTIEFPQKETKIQRSVALYYLKTGGPTGVDNVNRNKRGLVGSIAYIDHNGERHAYPQSALSYTKPVSYITLNGYDTRSAESSYGIKDARIRNKFPPLATMPNWEMNIQFTLNGGSGWQPLIGNMYNDTIPAGGWGVWVSPSKNIHWSWKYNKADFGFKVEDGKRYNLKIINSPATLTMVLRNMEARTEQKGASNKVQNDVMATEGPVTIGGWKNNSNEKFTGKIHSISIPKLYSIDNPDMNGAEVPLSNPTPVNESVDGTLEKCSKICDDDANCGGFVYTKPTTGGAEGKCELKDRAKMFPVGVRVKDPTKQLMIKVPTINGTISDEKCKINNGAAYKIIDSAQYRHYPDKGAMTSSSKCDIRSLIPKDGDLQPIDFRSMFGAVDEVFEETNSKIAEYGAQTAVTSASNAAAEGFRGMREGMEVSSTYADTMKGVGDDLKKIANAEYQRERLLAITEETNKLLMAETYKFILWSVLAILAVLALLKLKEMFGQDESEGGGEGGEGGGGLLATILGWFGIGSMNLDDVQDRTEDAKAALSAAGDQLREAGANISTGITEGADNLVNSATDAATGAIDGANNLVDKAKETASGAIDQIGAPSPTTGGKRSVKRKP
jgi:hypothetical protein